MWLWHDRALPHFGRSVTEFFDEDYERKWIAEVDWWHDPLILLT
jgi:hypothetical protein